MTLRSYEGGCDEIQNSKFRIQNSFFDGFEGRRDGFRHRHGPGGRGDVLEPGARDHQHHPFVAVDQLLLEGGLETGERSRACGFGKDARQVCELRNRLPGWRRSETMTPAPPDARTSARQPMALRGISTVRLSATLAAPRIGVTISFPARSAPRWPRSPRAVPR